jgi:hypothetical protein
MRRALPFALLALLLLPVAAAGSASAPEVRGTRDKPNPEGDVLAAWVSRETDGLRISIQMARVDPGAERNVVCWMGLVIGGRDVGPTMGFDEAGNLLTDGGTHPSGWGGPGYAANVDNALLHRAAIAGDPGTLTAVAPWGLYPGLRDGATVQVRAAFCSLFERGQWFAPYDEEDARSGTTYRIGAQQASLFPLRVPAWVPPLVVVACTLGGAGAGALLASRTRPRPPS